MRVNSHLLIFEVELDSNAHSQDGIKAYPKFIQNSFKGLREGMYWKKFSRLKIKLNYNIQVKDNFHLLINF